MTNTAKSFSEKWHKNADLAFANTLKEGSDIFNWIVGRNGWQDANGMRAFLENKRRVLDGGCGNGRVTALLRAHSSPEKTEIWGIDLTASDVAAANLEGATNVHLRKANLLDDLTSLGQFDFIYCQEVLHHTDDPAKSFSNLCEILAPGGEIAIYVYKLKAPVREYTDDYVRSQISHLPYEEALRHCAQITQLGKALSELQAKVVVPAVEVLGIEAGEYDVQRLVYHAFAKCFWNPELSVEANDVINYDWYHPQTATRHTLEEVRVWFDTAGLKINHEHVDPYGITVRGKLDN